MHRIVQTMEFSPGCCCYCRGGKTPAIDLDIERDDIGQALDRQYLCGNCVRDMAAYYADQVPDADFRVFRLGVYEEMKTRAAERERAIEMLTERAVAAEEALEALERANAARLLQQADVREQPELTTAPPDVTTSDINEALDLLAPPRKAVRKASVK